MHPSAAGLLSRLACARAMSAGIDVAPLMVKAGVTRKQVEDRQRSARGERSDQICRTGRGRITR